MNNTTTAGKMKQRDGMYSSTSVCPCGAAHEWVEFTSVVDAWVVEHSAHCTEEGVDVEFVA